MKILLDDVNELELKLEVEQQSSLLCHSHIEELVHIKDEHEYNEQRKKQSTSWSITSHPNQHIFNTVVLTLCFSFIQFKNRLTLNIIALITSNQYYVGPVRHLLREVRLLPPYPHMPRLSSRHMQALHQGQTMCSVCASKYMHHARWSATAKSVR